MALCFSSPVTVPRHCHCQYSPRNRRKLETILFNFIYYYLFKGEKGQNQYLTCVFNGKIQITFLKCVLYPDKVILEILPLKV